MTLNIKFSDGVRHLYLPKLNTISQLTDNGMRYWLANSDSYFPLTTATSDFFEVEFYDLVEFLSPWASDINRLSCAFIETVTNIQESSKNKKFLAWNLINYYYSAFFSAHSILKILGFGLIQINDAITHKLKIRANIMGQQFPNVSSGIYCISIDPCRNRAVFYKVRRYDDSHRGLWKRFSDFLNVLTGIAITTGNYDANCIITRPAAAPHPLSIYSNMPSGEATAVVSMLDDLKKVLNTNGDNNWLSATRHLINYNHEFGIWFPYKSYHKQYDKITNLNDWYNIAPLNSKFDTSSEEGLVKFVKISQLINSMNFDILSDLCRRHPTNKSFLKNGFFAYDKLYAK